jgi:hypothetical protein
MWWKSKSPKTPSAAVRRGRAALAWQKEITTPATRHVPLHLAGNRIPAEIPWSLQCVVAGCTSLQANFQIFATNLGEISANCPFRNFKHDPTISQ